MNARGFLWGAVLVLLACAAQAGQRHAILIGVVQPSRIASIQPLTGVKQDIALMSDLANAWGVSAANKQILTQDGTATVPTLAAVQAAFDRLAEQVKSGDEVLLYLAGPGTQQPPSTTDDFNENDLVDRVFLLDDSAPGNNTSINNALLEKDLRRQIEKLALKGVFVWLVVDSSQAGGMSRGNSDAVPATDEWTAVASRRVAPETLGIDPSKITTKQERRPKLLRKHIPGLAMKAAPEDAGMPPIMAFYAAPESGGAIEVVRKSDGQRVGLFTWKLKMTFDDLARRTDTPPNFEALAHSLFNSYNRLPTTVAKPVMDGSQWERSLWNSGRL